MKVFSRLKKIASIEDLSEMNVSQTLINQILQGDNTGVSSEYVTFRRLMNSNTKFVVEIWSLNDGTFGVFSGYFEGQWNPDIVNYHGSFQSESEAELYVQDNLQQHAESKENLLARKKKAREMMTAGKEPEYSKLAKDFLKSIDIKDPKNINKYYRDWVQYMNHYYPEWAAYPAFIWRGWGYVSTIADNKENTDQKNDSDKSTTQNENTYDSVDISFSGGDMGGGSGE